MTRRRAELGTITTSDLKGFVREQISEDVVEAQRRKQIGDQLVIENDALEGAEDDSLRFYKRGTLKASEVAEGASIEDNAGTETTINSVITCTVNKYAVYDSVTREAIMDGRIDIIDGVTTEMGEALADKKDQLILKRLCNDEGNTETSVHVGGSGNPDKTGKLANNGVLEIDKIIDQTPGHSNTELTHYDWSPATGSIATYDLSSNEGTIETHYSFANVSVQASSSKDELSLDDVASAKYKLTGSRFEPDSLVVSPKFISFLEQTTKFQDAYTYQGELPQAAEGRLFSMDVMRSDNLPDMVKNYQERDGGYIALVVDSDMAMPYLPKRGVEVERYDDKNEQVMKLYATERYGVGGDSYGSRLLRENAVAMLAIDHALN